MQCGAAGMQSIHGRTQNLNIERSSQSFAKKSSSDFTEHSSPASFSLHSSNVAIQRVWSFFFPHSQHDDNLVEIDESRVSRYLLATTSIPQNF